SLVPSFVFILFHTRVFIDCIFIVALHDLQGKLSTDNQSLLYEDIHHESLQLVFRDLGEVELHSISSVQRQVI
ncbi:hypothetical protein Q5741_03790, partial [Paenibacillus sp. JX-17]|nr:hypothetical protein [Paenibacillus sp. JX-17]